MHFQAKSMNFERMTKTCYIKAYEAEFHRQSIHFKGDAGAFQY